MPGFLPKPLGHIDYFLQGSASSYLSLTELALAEGRPGNGGGSNGRRRRANHVHFQAVVCFSMIINVLDFGERELGRASIEDRAEAALIIHLYDGIRILGKSHSIRRCIPK